MYKDVLICTRTPHSGLAEQILKIILLLVKVFGLWPSLKCSCSLLVSK